MVTQQTTAEDAVFDINAGLTGAGVTEVVASEGPDPMLYLSASTGRDIAVNSLHSDFGPSSID